MKRRLLLFIISILAISFIHAQGFVIQGRVVDANNVNDVLPQASVQLLRNDTAFVAGVAADESGFFALKAKEEGKYKLQISFVGYEILVRKLELKKENTLIKLGNLLLRQDERLLKEVRVTGLAQELTIKADTFLYHANAFRVPEGSTISALIKQLPGLAMDSEGNLTFQGKEVSSILVNGKPFIGDSKTAMSNIVSDAVQDVAVYEKSDEEKEFAGVHDTEKATVVDLKIKKEYQSQWSVNADAGLGTHSKYIAKAFASNFTDKRRSALYAQVNNISENLVADENGNWQSDSWRMSGLYTYRKAGAIMSWDNGKANKDARYMKLDTEIEIGHESGNLDQTVNMEYLLGGGINHFSYMRSMMSVRDRNINTKVDFTFNIDTLNRLTATLAYRYQDNNNNNLSNSSTYSKIADIANPETGLIGNDVNEELKAVGINSNASQGYRSRRNSEFTIDTRFVHRFKKEGYSLNAGVKYSVNTDSEYSDGLICYRYFNSVNPFVVDRRYNVTPCDNSNFEANLALQGAFNKNIQFTASYGFSSKKNDDECDIYRLDRYPYYSQQDIPLGVRPSTADSLAAVIDIKNSEYSNSTRNSHNLSFGLSGVWNKVEASAGANIEYNDESLSFEKAEMKYSPSRGYFKCMPRVSFKWKPVKNGEIRLSYYGYSTRPSLLELLPITDTSDEMVERVNNTELKTKWTNNFNLYSRWFNEKRGDSYSLYAYYSQSNNSDINIIVTDPLSGKKRYTKDNVNGNYSIYVGFNTEQPLDKERHWTLSLNGSYNINRDKSYMGTTGDELGLSVVHRHNAKTSMLLKWRSGMWSVNLSGKYSAEIARYGSTPEYNQDGHTFECSFQPQVELPFGMKINASLMLYGRRGYADDIMNHDQWLLNATISQSLLKNKALTLQLEAVDLLQQRTAEYSYVSPSMRYFSREKVFFSYVMLHAIYRFNIGGSK